MLKSHYAAHQAFFSQQAHSWHFPDEDRRLLTRLLPALQIRTGATVLDMGCGPGQITNWLKALFPTAIVVGIDMCAAMIRARDKATPDTLPLFVQAYAEQLPIRTESCDLILNYCVFPHLLSKNLVVAEYRRVLKPEGRVIIIHPGGRNRTNQKHRAIGFPVDQDLLPATAELTSWFRQRGFGIGRVIDDEEVFLLEIY